MTAAEKIGTLEETAARLEKLRAEGKKVAHCHGVFDLLHIGHLRHLRGARGLADALVVTITPDRFVNKGPGRPAFTETLRAEALAMLECVDFVAINQWPTAVEPLGLLKADIYVKGSDYRDASKDVTGGIVDEQRAVEAHGGSIVFTDDIMFSSSNLINRHFSSFPKEVSTYLSGFSARHPISEVFRYLNGGKNLKILLVGETIIDDYVYCETMGKSGKEPILAARQLRSEQFAGGSIAVANHLAAFCDNVHLLTFLGTIDSHEEFVRTSLNPKVVPNFIYLEDEPTIVKRRFVERYPFQKMFELYRISEKETHNAGSDRLAARLEDTLGDYDLVLALDYGHGMIDHRAVRLLTEQARFLSVNTQVNAHNRGFNTISKYPRADYICLSENEIRLDCRTRQQNLRELIRVIADRHGCERVTVTRGQQGCLCYSKGDEFYEVPPFTTHIVDRVGAGDTVFAVTSIAAVQNAPTELIGFVGNIVGAHAVGMVANQRPLDRVPLMKHIETILK